MLGLAVSCRVTAVAVAVGAVVAGTGVGSLCGIWVEVGSGSGVAKAATRAWFSGGTGGETVGRGADPWLPPQAEINKTVKIVIIGRTTYRFVISQF